MKARHKDSVTLLQDTTARVPESASGLLQGSGMLYPMSCERDEYK